MNLQRLIEQHISFQQSLGTSSTASASILRAFGRARGARARVAAVRAEHVDAFLGKARPVTMTWFAKLSHLRSFFHYAVSRGHLTAPPLPTVMPKQPPAFVPHIYTREELRRVLQVIESHSRRSNLEPATIRTMILVFYGAGLRLREATNLTRADVDLGGSVQTIRNTKFGKTRLVPVGPQLSRALVQYDGTRPRGRPAEAPFFATRNQRLAAVHSLARFIGLHGPEHLDWCGQIQTIAFKKVARPLVAYLEKDELDALLKAPDHRTAQGRRDDAVLLFLYNTGARANEVAQVRIAGLDLGAASSPDASSVLLRGKGNKPRRCPLWPRTANKLRPLIDRRAASQPVFLNRRGQPLTRFGIHALVERYAAHVATKLPSLAKKRVSPHTIRHTTATHLLRSGVDINTIRAWLGHVCLSTTNVYAEVDLEMKAKALVKCEIKDGKPKKAWRKNPGLMEFLRTL